MRCKPLQAWPRPQPCVTQMTKRKAEALLTGVVVSKAGHGGGPVGVGAAQLAGASVVQVQPHKRGHLRVVENMVSRWQA